MSRRQLRAKYDALWLQFAAERDPRKRYRIQKRAERIFSVLAPSEKKEATRG